MKTLVQEFDSFFHVLHFDTLLRKGRINEHNVSFTTFPGRLLRLIFFGTVTVLQRFYSTTGFEAKCPVLLSKLRGFQFLQEEAGQP